MTSRTLLSTHDLHAFYGKSHVLHGVDFEVQEGQIAALLGRNGSGRSTTALAIMGAIATRGSVLFKGEEIRGLKAHEIARRGIGLVPENREVFPTLTVFENLRMGQKPGARQSAPRWTVEELLNLFPRLRERAGTAAGVLSGGEQQLLTICRTLVGDPDLMIVDEPTEGLAPMMVEVIADLLPQIAQRGTAVLLIEQKLTIALRISKNVHVMGRGQIVFSGTPGELMTNTEIHKDWLEV